MINAFRYENTEDLLNTFQPYNEDWWVSRPFDEAFYIPEGFEGCASIVYNIRGVHDLEVRKHTIQYHLDKDGILLTNSPADFGW